MSSMLGDIRFLKSFRNTILILFLLAAFLVGSTLPVRAQAPSFFGDAGAAADNGPASAFASRSRLVTANLGLLLNSNGSALDASSMPQLALNLFPDTSFTGVVTKLTNYDSDTHTWSGVLQNVTGGYFYLATSGGKLAGHVASSKGVYEITAAGDNLYRVAQLDESKMVDEPNEGRDIPAGKAPVMADAGTLTDSASRIDVMVVYTSAARIGAGGTAAMKAAIALAMTETNTAYFNAGITTRLRLVHTQEVSYTEPTGSGLGVFSTDLSRLVNPIDGYMDNVHALRNQYGADMVSLIVENGGGYCGLANAIMATAPGAFDVVQRSGCMTGYYSFGHEFGHLQGARHDRYVDGTLTPFSYGHGYTHPVTGAAWRTVMAYNDKCASVGLNCTRLQYFSNPSKLYNSAAMGDAYSKNYSVLNATALTVANFRTQVIGNDFYSNFNTTSSGWTAVNGQWLLSSAAYLTTTGLANVSTTIKHSGVYGDLTYTARLFRSGTCTGCDSGLIIRGNPASLTSSKDWKPSYYFAYTNSGAFAVYYVNSAGTYYALKAFTATTAIAKNNWNVLKVVAVGSTLKYYINGVLVWSGVNAGSATGGAGIYMYRDASTAKLYVDYANLATSATAADTAPVADAGPAVAVPASQAHMH